MGDRSKSICHLECSRVKPSVSEQGVAGETYSKVLSPHPFFKLEGSDIFCQVPITPSEAVLGVPVEVPTLDGSKIIHLGGSGQLRLAGGYPTENGRRGDQLVEIQLVRNPSDQERERSCGRLKPLLPC